MLPVRYKPLIDKLYLFIFIPTELLVLSLCVISAIFSPVTLFVTIPIFLFTTYFLISPFFGYVECREEGIFIKYGFIMKKFIPYNKIRSLEKTRRFYSESMMSLKCAYEHVNLKYNTFDVTTVSVKDNEGLIQKINELKER